MTVSTAPLRVPPPAPIAFASEPTISLFAAVSTMARSSWYQDQAPLSLNCTSVPPLTTSMAPAAGAGGVAGNTQAADPPPPPLPVAPPLPPAAPPVLLPPDPPLAPPAPVLPAPPPE